MISDILPGILAECGIDRTSPTIVDASFEIRQLRELMNEAGRDINARADWARAVKVVTAADVAFIDLPNDFLRISAVTVGDDDHVPARPVLSPEMWQMLEKLPSDQTFFHLKEGRIYFSPAIDPLGVTVRYVSSNWLVTKAAITADTDAAVFPDHLLRRGAIWRWKRQKGLPYDDILAEYEADLDTAIRMDRGA